MSAPAAPAAAVGGGGCGVEWSGQAGELGGATDNAHQARESRQPTPPVTHSGRETETIITRTIYSAVTQGGK